MDGHAAIACMGKSGGMGSMGTLTALQRAGCLTDGQVVTALVGVAVCMRSLHNEERFTGWLHPRDVELDPSGRPRVRAALVPADWTSRDDVLALLRLGHALTKEGSDLRHQLRQRAATESGELAETAAWLLTLAAPQTLGCSERTT